MSTTFIGLKLSSTTTCIYKSGNGIVLKEASLIAMPTNPKIKEPKAIGNDAKKLIGKTGENLTVYSPISNGIIQYDELAVLMLKGFLKKVFPVKSFGENIKAVLCVPLGLSASEKKQFEIACFKSGIADVFIVPDIISFALGSGIDIKSETSAFIVNIGGDTTNIASVSNLSIINGYNLNIGGSIINIAIAKFIEENHGLHISAEQAERLKIEICSLFENYSASTTIVGIDKNTNLKQEISITATELYPIINHYYSKIAEMIGSVIQSSDPEIIADISRNGIYFYGGASHIVGLEKFMFDKLKFKINISDNQYSNLLGIAELIKYPQMLKKIIKNN